MPRLALVVKATVDVAHDVFDGAHTHFRALILSVAGERNDPVDVDARLAVEEPPDHAGEVEHERLQQQDDGDPLVVGQLLLRAATDVLRHDEVHRDVIRVGDPADVVRVVHVRSSELKHYETSLVNVFF